MGVYQEIGPQRPSRLQVRVMAAEVHALARIALELTMAGPQCDVERALRQMDKIRAVLGEGAMAGVSTSLDTSGA